MITKMNKRAFRSLHMSYKTLIRDVRSQAVGSAVKFVNDKMKKIMRQLTSEFHMLLEQFISFRKETADRISYMQGVYEKYKDAMAQLAIRAPVHEAAYGMMEQTPLKLYDCLMPRTQHYQYKRGLHCNKCKAKREEFKIYDAPMSVDKMAATSTYWKYLLQENEVSEYIEKNKALENEA